ncbi:MAG: DUF2244 domain-containing protein [Alphaproteobacteria bacterium]|nr:DUF2244 domain-containing protein [Alphaproteobacteria bacterium]
MTSAYVPTLAGAGLAVYAGAWPIGVFLVAMPLALQFAFSASNKSAKAHEILRFHENDFEITRVDEWDRVVEHITLPAWQTRFFSEGDVDTGLRIFAHGPGPDGQRKAYPIGAFLSLPEQEELLKLLQEALNFQGMPYHLQDEARHNQAIDDTAPTP